MFGEIFWERIGKALDRFICTLLFINAMIIKALAFW